MKNTKSLLVFAALTMSVGPVFADAADDVIATAKAEWVAENARDIPGSLKAYAEDYTELNSEAPTRIEGKGMAARLADASNKDVTTALVSEMMNPKVQVFGDTAILSYNYYGRGVTKEGKVEATRAKSTRVYNKQGGKWMLVHGHFTADPMPK